MIIPIRTIPFVTPIAVPLFSGPDISATYAVNIPGQDIQLAPRRKVAITTTGVGVSGLSKLVIIRDMKVMNPIIVRVSFLLPLNMKSLAPPQNIRARTLTKRTIPRYLPAVISEYCSSSTRKSIR